MQEPRKLERTLPAHSMPVIVISILVFAALGSFALSFYWESEMDAALGQFIDCSGIDTFPPSSACADDARIAAYENLRAKSQLSFFLGLILLLGVLYVPAVRAFRRESEVGMSIPNDGMGRHQQTLRPAYFT